VIALLVLIAACTLHVPQSITASSRPLPGELRIGERVTVESCGSEGMDELIQRAKGDHDALIEITLSTTTYFVPFLSFLNPTSYELSGTQVDFGVVSKARATEAAATSAGTPASALRLAEMVYREIGRSPPEDEAQWMADAELLFEYAKAGKSPSEILAPARAGAAKVGKSGALREILIAGFDGDVSPTFWEFE
jgi:hypothetical protein